MFFTDKITSMGFNDYSKTEHAFKSFAKDIKGDFASNVIFMYGNEDFLIDWATNEIIKKFVNPQMLSMDYDKLDDDSLSVDDIINSCETFSMMSEKRVVIVKNYLPVTKNNAKGFTTNDLSKLSDYIDNPNSGTILVFCNPGLINDLKDKREKRSDLDDLLLKKALCYNFCQLDSKSLAGFADKRFRSSGYSISNDALRYLIDVTGYLNKESDYRLSNLANDIEKIIAHSSDQLISKEDIDCTICGDSDTYVFNFLDAVSSNKKGDAYTILHNLLNDGNDVFSLLSLLIGQFEMMTEVSELKEEGLGLVQITKEMGIHEFRIKKALAYSEKFTSKKLKEILGQLYETDTMVKNGDIAGDVAMELIIGRI